MCDIKFIHPGEHLEEFLEDLEITQSKFAEILGVTAYRVSQIMNCRAPITADMALRIAKAFSQSAELWMNLQRTYDLEVARATVDVSGIQPLYEPLPDDWTPPLEAEKTEELADSLAARA